MTLSYGEPTPSLPAQDAPESVYKDSVDPVCFPADAYIPLHPFFSAEIDEHWRAARYALLRLQKRGLILGAVGSEEVAVEFLPARGIFHFHAVVHSEAFGEDEVVALKKAVERYLTRRNLRFRLPPSIRFRAIRGQADLNGLLRYLGKHVDLADPYTAAVRRLRYEPAALFHLNVDKDTVIDALTAITYDRRMIFKCGSLSPYSGVSYIGKLSKKAQKAKFKKEVREWLAADEQP